MKLNLKILLSVGLLSGAVLVSATFWLSRPPLVKSRPAGQKKPSAGQVAVRQTVQRFLGRKIKINISDKVNVPTGKLVEARSRDGGLFFQVDEKKTEVIYASLGEIKVRETSAVRLNRRQALRLALKFAAKHRRELAGFQIDAEQADFYWPKPTYWTFIWRGRPPKRAATDFAKVTVDAVSGKVISFGIGSPKWSSFCLPDKKQAPWADSK